MLKIRFPHHLSTYEWSRPTLLRGLPWMTRQLFQLRGFRWEARRSGELKLGYWRKQFRPKSRNKTFPKRLVLIPGFGDSPISWFSVFQILTPLLKYEYDELILIEFPGFFGYLNRDKSFPSLERMIHFLGDTLDSLKPHTILGHSLGGWLASNYAAECGSGGRPISNPKNYSGPNLTLLISPSGIFPNEEIRNGVEALFSFSEEIGLSQLRPHLFAKEPIWFKWVAHEFINFINREDIQQFMRTITAEHSVQLENKVKNIKSQVWLIWGEKDTLVPVSCAETWLKALNSDLNHQHHFIKMKKIGHAPQIESPVSTAILLAKILNKKAGSLFSLGSRPFSQSHSEIHA